MADAAGSALVSRRNLRLASGLTLFAYAGLHLVNHALGLHSLAAAEAMLAVAVRVWSSVPGTLLLYGAGAIHVGLAFLALYERRTLRMPPIEALRYALGFAIPLLLITVAIIGVQKLLLNRKGFERAAAAGCSARLQSQPGVTSLNHVNVSVPARQSINHLPNGAASSWAGHGLTGNLKPLARCDSAGRYWHQRVLCLSN